MSFDFSVIVSGDVFPKVSEAVRDGLAHVRELQERSIYILRYSEFPKISHWETGLPWITPNLYENNPIDYTNAFGILGNTKQPFVVPQSWKDLVDYASGVSQLRRYFLLREDQTPEVTSRSSNEVFGTLGRLVNRYIHLCGTTEFHEDKFAPIYHEWEKCAFDDELSFDLLVPLLCITFDADVYELGPQINIERLSDGIQLAREKEKSSDLARYECLTAAATHALVLKNWVWPNDNWVQRYVTLSEINNLGESVNKAERFLAALRATTGAEIGWSQMVTRPHGWGDRWPAHLPHIEVATSKAYPEHFQNNAWRRQPPVISEAQCETAHDLFLALEQSGEHPNGNKLLLAARRLNMAALRSREEDTILDLTIALEALLADDSKGEIVYRLSLRMGMLARLEPFENLQPFEVMALLKKVYDYRSAVVHGGTHIEKKRSVQVPGVLFPVPAVELGLRLLRWALGALARRPHLLDVRRLEEQCLNETSKRDVS